MVSVETWKKHFKSMAHRAFPNEDMYIVNQSGRGLGRNAFNKTTYKIRGSPKKSEQAVIEIVSPVAQEVERAKVLLGREPIKRKSCKKKGSSKKGRCSGKVKKRTKKPSKKKATKKKKAAGGKKKKAGAKKGKGRK